MVAPLRVRIAEIIEARDVLDPIALAVEYDCTRFVIEIEIQNVMMEMGLI